MADALWGSDGPPSNWCRLHGVSDKGVINMVCEVACNQHDSGATLVLVHPSNFFARIEDMPVIGDGAQTITLTDLIYVGMKRLHTFKVTEETVVKSHSRVEHRDFFSLTELCCGMGVATQGFKSVGVNTVLACDANPNFVAAFRHLHPGVTVISGDVNHQSTIRQIVAASARPTMGFAGFSCQPYSKGGARLGADDSRSSSLAGVLEVFHLLRCPVITLECVPDAATNKHVRATLAAFCRQCSYHLSEIELHQDHVWPCKRDRWWVVMTAISLSAVNLKAFPKSPYPTCVKQILPHCWNVELSELDELKLSPSEHERFVQFRPDLSSMLLTARGICPTILHSCGSQVLPCACQCRSVSFSDQTLSSRGIFGILFPTEGITMIGNRAVAAMRHPHPSEIAILTGCLLPDCWPSNLRLSLAGLGQQATPIQSLWICSQILSHVDLIIGGVTQVSPCSNLDRFLTELLLQTKNCFANMSKPVIASYDVMPQIAELPADETELDIPCPQSEVDGLVRNEELQGDVARVDWLHHGEGLSFTIVTSPDFHPLIVPLGNSELTVGHLIAAEIGMLPSLSYVEVLDPASGIKIDQSVKLQGQCVLLCSGLASEAPEDHEPKKVDGYETCSPSFEEISPTLFFAVDPEDIIIDEVDNAGSPSKKKPRTGFVPDPTDSLRPLESEKNTNMVISEPLVSLKPHQLLAMAPPVISNMQVFSNMIKPNMSVDDRIAVLEAQGTAWADDEVRWHINQVVEKANRPGVFFLDPLIANECLVGTGDKLLHDWLLTLPQKPKIILSAVCVNEHWTPFAWTYASDCLQANSWDLQASAANTKLFNQLHDKLSKALGCRTFLSRVLHRSIATAEGCGVCAFRFLDYFLRAKMLPTSNSEVEQLHHDGKSMFLAHLKNAALVERPWTWGFGLDPQVSDRLHLLLEQHGVPKDQCEQRAFVIQQALGTQVLQKALLGTSPWRSIKASANQLRPPLHLILPDELKASIQAKVGQKGDGKRKKKQHSKAQSLPVKPTPLDPVKLRFDEGAFVSDDGSPLQQIQVGQLGPLVEGVALTTLGSVEQFLRAGAVVSKGHLAVFVLNADEASMTTRLPWTLSRVALRCIANNEPMLIQGFVVQLGSKFVQQGKARHEVEVEDVGAACVKFAIYRDQVASWDEVVAGPVKFRLNALEMLVPCNGHDDAHSCSKWHPGKESSVRDPVFDVWRRQWLSLSMQACSPSQASIFMVNVRYAKSLENEVLAHSGHNGIFMEPRSLDAKSAVFDYQVIWLPRKSMPEVLHIRQTNPCILGIARLGSRIGVRVKVADAQVLSKSLRPESVLLPSGPRMDFELGPLPYGLDRSGVAGLCKSWGWIAKPVNPSRSVVGDLGTIWLVQSCTDPPSSVFSLKGNDVVVTKLQSKPAKDMLGTQPAVASPATLSLCAFDSKESVGGSDPWLQADPWGYDASKSKQVKAVAPDISLNLQQIEDRIEQSVLAKMPKASSAMDIDESSLSSDNTAVLAHQDARINALESQVNRLMSGHQVLEQKVEEGARKTEAQISQVQHHMSAQLEAQGSKIEDLFQSQLSRLESLLNKKARME